MGIGWSQVYYANSTCNHELHNYICINALGFHVELVAYKWWMNCRIRLLPALHVVSLAKVCSFLFLLLWHRTIRKTVILFPGLWSLSWNLWYCPLSVMKGCIEMACPIICNHRGLLIRNLRFIPIWFGEFLLPIWFAWNKFESACNVIPNVLPRLLICCWDECYFSFLIQKNITINCQFDVLIESLLSQV